MRHTKRIALLWLVAFSLSMGFTSAYAETEGHVIEVAESPAPAGRFYDDTDPAISYTGSWGAASGGSYARAYNGTIHLSTVANSKAFFTFTGRQVTFMYSMAANRGDAFIYLDSQYQTMLDMYAPEVRRQVSRTFTASYDGVHTLEIHLLNGYLDVDAFIVDAALTPESSAVVRDDRSSDLRYIEYVTRFDSISGAYLNTTSHTTIPGRGWWLIFNNSRLEYVFSKAPNRGLVAITIDGYLATTIDLYAPTIQRQQSLIFDLGPGPHTFHVTVLEQKNPAATAYGMDVDMVKTGW